nr:hypothetical protein CFP56_21869 [Quercus suber]
MLRVRNLVLEHDAYRSAGPEPMPGSLLLQHGRFHRIQHSVMSISLAKWLGHLAGDLGTCWNVAIAHLAPLDIANVSLLDLHFDADRWDAAHNSRWCSHSCTSGLTPCHRSTSQPECPKWLITNHFAFCHISTYAVVAALRGNHIDGRTKRRSAALRPIVPFAIERYLEVMVST